MNAGITIDRMAQIHPIQRCIQAGYILKSQSAGSNVPTFAPIPNVVPFEEMIYVEGESSIPWHIHGI
jgi:hypothetical protein